MERSDNREDTAQNRNHWKTLCLLLPAILPMQGELFAAPGDKKWEFEAGRYVRSTPAIGPDGTVYLVADGNGYALNRATGEERWRFRGGSATSSPIISANGLVFLGTKSGGMVALNQADGTLEWFARRNDPVLASPALALNDILFFASNRGDLYALDTESQFQLWRTRIEEEDQLFSSPAIGADGTIYIGTPRRGMMALEPLSGDEQWAFQSETVYDSGWIGGFHASPAIGGDGTVYVGATDGTFYAFDGLTGAIKWQFEIGVRITSSAAVGPDETVYFGSDDGRVYALDGTSGQLRWRFPTGGAVHSSPTLTEDGALYIGSYDGKLYALDSATGVKRWEFATDGFVLGSAGVAEDGTVYIGSYDGKLYALEGTAKLADSPWPKFRRDARNTASAQTLGPPRIISFPSSLFVPAGSEVTLGAIVEGSRPLEYQWFFNDQPIAETSASSLAITEVSLDDVGDYRLVVRNENGQTDSTASLKVGFRLTVGQRRGGGIVVDPDLSLYKPGATIELTAIPDEGQRFLGWLGDAEGNATPTVLTLDQDRFIAAKFDLGVGETIWEFDVGSGFAATPAIAPDGTVYLSAYEPANTLYAIDGATGAPSWKFQSGETPGPYMPVLSEHGTLYVTFDLQRLYALDAASGSKLWTYQTDGQFEGHGPALGPNGWLYVRMWKWVNELRGESSQWIDAVDGKTAERKWRTALSRRGAKPTVSADGKVFLTERDHSHTSLVVLDGMTGNLWWRFEPEGGVGLGDSPSIGADGTAYIPAAGTSIVALDVTKRSERWRSELGVNVFAAPIIGADGTLFVAGGTRKLFSLNADSGRIIWEKEADADIIGSPILSKDGTLHIVTAGPRLLALDAVNGNTVWEKNWPSLPEYVIDRDPALSPDGTLYVMTGWPDRKLYAIQASSGLARSAWPKLYGDLGNTGLGQGPLRIARPTLEGSTFRVSIPTIQGQTYRLEICSSLDRLEWRPVFATEGDGFEKQLVDPDPLSEQRFYRVRFETTSNLPNP